MGLGALFIFAGVFAVLGLVVVAYSVGGAPPAHWSLVTAVHVITAGVLGMVLSTSVLAIRACFKRGGIVNLQDKTIQIGHQVWSTDAMTGVLVARSSDLAVSQDDAPGADEMTGSAPIYSVGVFFDKVEGRFQSLLNSSGIPDGSPSVIVGRVSQDWVVANLTEFRGNPTKAREYARSMAQVLRLPVVDAISSDRQPEEVPGTAHLTEASAGLIPCGVPQDCVVRQTGETRTLYFDCVRHTGEDAYVDSESSSQSADLNRKCLELAIGAVVSGFFVAVILELIGINSVAAFTAGGVASVFALTFALGSGFWAESRLPGAIQLSSSRLEVRRGTRNLASFACSQVERLRQVGDCLEVMAGRHKVRIAASSPAVARWLGQEIGEHLLLNGNTAALATFVEGCGERQNRTVPKGSPGALECPS